MFQICPNNFQAGRVCPTCPLLLRLWGLGIDGQLLLMLTNKSFYYIPEICVRVNGKPEIHQPDYRPISVPIFKSKRNKKKNEQNRPRIELVYFRL